MIWPNHIIWHAGHCLWLQDVLCEQLLGWGGHLPPDWPDKFGMNCRPPSQTRDWPSHDMVIALLTEQLGRVLTLLASTTEQTLGEVADARRGPATISARVIHGFHDEAKHCGEMYLLLKLHRSQGGLANE